MGESTLRKMGDLHVAYYTVIANGQKTAKTIGMRIKKRIFDEPDTETDETCRLLRANKEH